MSQRVTTPLVVNPNLQGFEMKAVVAGQVRIPPSRIKYAGVAKSDREEESIPVTPDGRLVPGRLYPSALKSESGLRYYLPCYQLRMEQGQHTSSLRFRGPDDDPQGPQGWLTVEMRPETPDERRFEIKAISHQAQLRLGYRLVMAKEDAATSGNPENDSTGLMGQWENMQGDAGMRVSRILVRKVGTRYRVQVFGKKEDGELDWGERQARFDTGTLTCVYPFPGRSTRLTLRLFDQWLHMELIDDFAEDSADSKATAMFERVRATSFGESSKSSMLWLPLGALERQSDKFSACRYPFHSRAEFDNLFQVLTNQECEARLQIVYEAIAGQRTWKQLLTGFHPKMAERQNLKILSMNNRTWKTLRRAAADVEESPESNAGVVRTVRRRMRGNRQKTQKLHVNRQNAASLRRRPVAVARVRPELLNPVHRPVAVRRPFPVRPRPTARIRAFDYIVKHQEIRGFRATLNHPDLNNNPKAVIVATPLWRHPGPYYIHPFAFRYMGSRWVIENLDRKPVPANARFHMLVVSDARALRSASDGSIAAFVHKVTQRTLQKTGSHISNLSQSRDASSLLFATQIVSSRVNPHPVGIYFNKGRRSHALYNENRKPMPLGACFHVLDFKKRATNGLFVHTSTRQNTRGHVTTLNHSLCNNNPTAIIVVSHDYGVRGPYLTHPVGVWYNRNRWTVFTQNRKPMPEGVRFRILVLPNGNAGKPSRPSGGKDGSEVVVDSRGEPVLAKKSIRSEMDLQSFTFPLPEHDYMFDVPVDPVKNRVFFRNSVPIPGGGAVTVFQDSLFRHQLYYEPQEFRLTRHGVKPYHPSIGFAFKGVSGENEEPEVGENDFEVQLAFKAVPYLPPEFLLEVRQKFGSGIALAPLLPVESSLVLNVPRPDGEGTEATDCSDASVDFEDGIVHSMNLSRSQFERIFAGFIEPGGFGLQGMLQATLSDQSSADIPVNLSLSVEAGWVFDSTFVGPVPDQPGVYQVNLRNRIESPVLLREQFAIPIGEGVTAFPSEDNISGTQMAPGETAALTYRLEPASAMITSLTPSLVYEVLPDMLQLHKNITFNELPSDRQRDVEVTIDSLYFEIMQSSGDAMLRSVCVEFDSGEQVELTSESPTAVVALPVPFLVRLLLGSGEEEDFTYNYTVTYHFSDDSVDETGPFEGVGNLEVMPEEN